MLPLPLFLLLLAAAAAGAVLSSRWKGRNGVLALPVANSVHFSTFWARLLADRA